MRKTYFNCIQAGSNYEPTIKDCLEDIEIDERERNFLLTKCRKSSTYEILRHLPVNPRSIH